MVFCGAYIRYYAHLRTIIFFTQMARTHHPPQRKANFLSEGRQMWQWVAD